MMKQSLTQRQKRALKALLNGSVMRENLDFVTGASNGPDLIANLRRLGLEIPCERVERYDKDGNLCYPGRYHLVPEDKVIAHEWLEGHSEDVTPQAANLGGNDDTL